MPNINYDREYANFSQMYGVEIDVAGSYDSQINLLRVKDFITESNSRDANKRAYLTVLTDALTAHLEKKTNMENRRDYNTSDVQIGEFIVGFEKVMQAKFLDEKENNPDLKREPYDGQQLTDVASEVWERVKYFNNPLPDVWANRIKKGNYTFEDLKKVTDTSIRNLEGAWAGSDLGEKKKDLADIIMAKQAMDKVKSQRTIAWRLNIFNLKRWIQENMYASELKAKIKTYTRRRLPVGNAVPDEYTKPMFSKALTRLIKFLKNPLASQQVENKESVKNVSLDDNVKTNVQNKENEKIEEKVIVYDTLSEQYKEQFRSLRMKKEAVSQIQKIFPMKESEAETIVEDAIEGMQELCESADRAKKNNGKDMMLDPNRHKSAVRPFKKAAKILEDYYDLKKTETSVKSQAIANLLVNMYGPKEAYPAGTFEKYANNYVVNNDKLHASMYPLINTDEYNELLAAMKDIYRKEKVDVAHLKEGSGNEPKSPKIEKSVQVSKELNKI